MAGKARPAAGPTATEPDECFLALEGELSRNVLDFGLMNRHRVDPANADIEHDIEARRARISEFYDAIAGSKPKTLAGAAVLLRWVPAMLGDEHEVDPGHLAMASQLMDTALAVVEKNAA